MHPIPWKTWLALCGVVVLAILFQFTALAQDFPTPTPTPLLVTPTPLHTIRELPPGDTTILVVGAILLVLIVVGAVLWTSRRAR